MSAAVGDLMLDKIDALYAENQKLIRWLQRHARFHDKLTDRKEWRELTEFLAQHQNAE